MKQIERVRDVITQRADLEDIYTINDFPIFPGVSEKPLSEDIFVELTFSISKGSGMIQLKKLVPEEVLYHDTHNSSLGRVWEMHHRQLAEFIKKWGG